MNRYTNFAADSCVSRCASTVSFDRAGRRLSSSLNMEIPLHPHGVALIDASDYAFVSAYRWNIDRRSHTSYAVAHVPRKRGHTVRMHRLILGLTDSRVPVDHANRNGLDNRRTNLRAATPTLQNANSVNRNKCGFRGIYYDAPQRRFRAEIYHHGEHIRLGGYKRASDAAHAYDKAARVLFGAFARLNFPTAGEAGAL